MSQVTGELAFQQFIIQRKKDLQRIARPTRGECEFDDVVNEAWLMTCSLSINDGIPLNLLDAGSQHQLISYLYQHLVRYTELNVRHAVRLDHALKGREHEEDGHPLAYLLTSNDGQDVLDGLIEHEAEAALDSSLAEQGSLAIAYVYLLRRFGNNMTAVADHLRISRSYAYRCCANARWLMTNGCSDAKRDR